MLSSALGPAIKAARKQIGLSRQELAVRAEVSVRLVAEVERGERPNVSLETVLRLLDLVGASATIQFPGGKPVVLGRVQSERAALAERAARRLQTWTGRHVYMHEASHDSEVGAPGRVHEKPLDAVWNVSQQAHAVATAPESSLQLPKKRRSR